MTNFTASRLLTLMEQSWINKEIDFNDFPISMIFQDPCL